MKTGQTILTGVLFVAMIAVAVLAWHQYGELIQLRAQLSDGDNAALKRQLADARKELKALQDRLAAMRGRRGGAGADGFAGDGGGGDGPGANDGRRGGRFGFFAEMANNPEFQKLMAIQAKGRLAATYGALFKSLNLTPDQLDQFQSLLADKQAAMMDVMQSAREQGINPRTDPDGFKTLMNQAVAQSDAAIQQALGDAGYAQYQAYQQTLPERNTVNSLQQQLSYTQTPLTDDEANQMITLLADNQPQKAGNGTSGTGNGGDSGPGPFALLNGGGNAKVTNDAVTQAAGVLSAPQISALQQIQAQQQAQQQMQQMMREAAQGSTPPPTTTTGGGKG
jgi:hypothetical protein